MKKTENFNHFTEYLPIIFQDKKFIQEWKNFIDYRIELDKKFTKHAAVLLMNRLNELSSGDVNTAIRLLHTAIVQGWKSVYPEKTFQFQQNNKQTNQDSNHYVENVEEEKTTKNITRIIYNMANKSQEEIQMIKQIQKQEEELFALNLPKEEENKKYADIHAQFRQSGD